MRENFKQPLNVEDRESDWQLFRDRDALESSLDFPRKTLQQYDNGGNLQFCLKATQTENSFFFGLNRRILHVTVGL